MTVQPYNPDVAADEAADIQDTAEAAYYSARAAYRHGDLRRAVGQQRVAHICAAAARAAYQTATRSYR